jgi:hypothetical protein
MIVKNFEDMVEEFNFQLNLRTERELKTCGFGASTVGFVGKIELFVDER